MVYDLLYMWLDFVCQYFVEDSCLYRRRQWHPTPVLLPGKSHGRRSLVGCSPWGWEESDMTEWLPFHFSLSCIGEGNGNSLQCSCLENPRDGEAWWAAVCGVTQSQTRLKRLSSSSSSSRLVITFLPRSKHLSISWLQSPSAVILEPPKIKSDISIITFKCKLLNAPTKKCRLAECIQKQDLYICCLPKTHFRPRDTYWLKVRSWKKLFHTNGN